MVSEGTPQPELDELIDELTRLPEPIYSYILVSHVDVWNALDLTMPQFKVLYAAAARGNVDSPFLGRRLKMLPSTLTRIVDRLVERDLVVRRVHPHDRRVVILEATQQGVDLINDLSSHRLPPQLIQAFSELSCSDLRKIRDGLAMMADCATKARLATPEI